MLEWGTLFTNWREGPTSPNARGANALNVSVATMDPFFALARFADIRMAPPVSNNWGSINDPELTRLAVVARTTFDADARDAALAKSMSDWSTNRCSSSWSTKSRRARCRRGSVIFRRRTASMWIGPRSTWLLNKTL